jgi:hypothetical protein
MLVTNSLKMDLNHKNQFIVGLALASLGNICSAGAPASCRRRRRPAGAPAACMHACMHACMPAAAAAGAAGPSRPPGAHLAARPRRDGARPCARRGAAAGERQPLHPQEGGAVHAPHPQEGARPHRAVCRQGGGAGARQGARQGPAAAGAAAGGWGDWLLAGPGQPLAGGPRRRLSLRVPAGAARPPASQAQVHSRRRRQRAAPPPPAAAEPRRAAVRRDADAGHLRV